MASASNVLKFPPSPDNYIELYNCCWKNVELNDVFVNLSNDFGRKPLREDLEKQIDQTWKKRLEQCPLLYNGSKFRLQSLKLEDNRLYLNIGLTCYRDFICTNMCSELTQNIKTWGLENYGDPHACFADPIGANGLLLSLDGDAVFIRRSFKVYEYPGMYHTPGGHPEPSELKNEENKVLDLIDMDPKNVAYELFHCISKEVRDEVNLPLESLSWPVLLGIIRNPMSSGRPEMCFYIRCSLTSQEIKKCYQKGGPEAYESTEIYFFTLSKTRHSEPSSEDKAFLSSLTPPAKATLHFFMQHLSQQ